LIIIRRLIITEPIGGKPRIRSSARFGAMVNAAMSGSVAPGISGSGYDQAGDANQRNKSPHRILLRMGNPAAFRQVPCGERGVKPTDTP
jgi:hypothetical protein